MTFREIFPQFALYFQELKPKNFLKNQDYLHMN